MSSISKFASSETVSIGIYSTNNTKYAYSYDGFNWLSKNFPSGNYGNLNDIAYGSGIFLITTSNTVSGNPSQHNILRSNNNGLNWSSYQFSYPNFNNNNSLYSISYAKNRFILDTNSTDKIFYYSFDGLNWLTGYTSGVYTSRVLNKVVYAQDLNLFIGIERGFQCNGCNVEVLNSTDGLNWSGNLLPFDGFSSDLIYGNGRFIVTRSEATRTGYTSTDGINWNAFLFPSNLGYYRIKYNNINKLYMSTAGGNSFSQKFAVSTNGLQWISTGDSIWGLPALIDFKDKFLYTTTLPDQMFVFSKLPYSFENQESGNLYSPSSTWNNGVGNANIGNWFFVDRAGTFRGIINTNQNGRTSIGSSGFFFAPSTGSAIFYVDGYFNLINPLINGQGISLNANYSWNGGMRGIEFKPLTDGTSIFRIEHGNGDDRIFLRGSGFSDQVILNNGFQQALNYNIVYQKTGILFEARNFVNNSLIYSTGIITNLSIRQVHFYVGNIQVDQTQQLNYGLGVNNLGIHYKQKVPF